MRRKRRTGEMFDVGVFAGHHSCELFLMMCASRIKGCNWPCPSSTACLLRQHRTNGTFSFCEPVCERVCVVIL